MNREFSSTTDGSVPSISAPYMSASFSRRHSGRARTVSYSLRPSVNQRGTREFDSWMANTCESSCQRTIAQLMSPTLGDIAVMTWPKQTPSAPRFGSPMVRTL